MIYRKLNQKFIFALFPFIVSSLCVFSCLYLLINAEYVVLASFLFLLNDILRYVLKISCKTALMKCWIRSEPNINYLQEQHNNFLQQTASLFFSMIIFLKNTVRMIHFLGVLPWKMKENIYYFMEMFSLVFD